MKKLRWCKGEPFVVTRDWDTNAYWVVRRDLNAVLNPPFHEPGYAMDWRGDVQPYDGDLDARMPRLAKDARRAEPLETIDNPGCPKSAPASMRRLRCYETDDGEVYVSALWDERMRSFASSARVCSWGVFYFQAGKLVGAIGRNLGHDGSLRTGATR